MWNGAIALSYPPPPPPPPILIDDSSWKNAAESFTIALILSLGGYKSAIAPVKLHWLIKEQVFYLIQLLFMKELYTILSWLNTIVSTKWCFLDAQWCHGYKCNKCKHVFASFDIVWQVVSFNLPCFHMVIIWFNDLG